MPYSTNALNCVGEVAPIQTAEVLAIPAQMSGADLDVQYPGRQRSGFYL